MRVAAFLLGCVVVGNVHGSCIHDTLNVPAVLSPQQYSSNSHERQGDSAITPAADATPNRALQGEREDERPVQVEVNPDFGPRQGQREHEEL